MNISQRLVILLFTSFILIINVFVLILYLNVRYVFSWILALNRNLLSITLIRVLLQRLLVWRLYLLIFFLKKLIFLLYFHCFWLGIWKRMNCCIVFTGKTISSFISYRIWSTHIVILSSPSYVLIRMIILVSHIDSMWSLILLWEVIGVVVFYNLFSSIDVMFDLVVFRHLSLFQQNQKQAKHERI